MNSEQVKIALRELADPAIAVHSQRFFKTGKGEYGEGDKFLGIRVPILRMQARKYQDISLKETQRLLKSAFHEERLCALLLLVRKFDKGGEGERTAIYKLYLNNTRYINNWDLVDSSAYKIVGAYLDNKDREPLYELSRSDSLWERRIAIISTFHFIEKHQFDVALDLSRRLIEDDEDLIHKAVGWMLREVGKRNVAIEKAFLRSHYKEMARTTLRYAIERFDEGERKQYLSGII